MQVSITNGLNFGNLLYETERPSQRRTTKQNKAVRIIKDKLFSTPLEDRLRGCKTDIVMVFTKDGDISMHLAKRLSPMDELPVDSYIPLNKYGTKQISTLFQLKTFDPVAIKKQMIAFMRQANDYLQDNNNPYNRSIEQNWALSQA